MFTQMENNMHISHLNECLRVNLPECENFEYAPNIPIQTHHASRKFINSGHCVCGARQGCCKCVMVCAHSWATTVSIRLCVAYDCFAHTVVNLPHDVATSFGMNGIWYLWYAGIRCAHSSAKGNDVCAARGTRASRTTHKTKQIPLFKVGSLF